VSLADKVWRGRRDENLELVTAGLIATTLKLPEWEAYSVIDRILQNVAAGADARLQAAKTSPS
jgi:hypothetical protein